MEPSGRNQWQSQANRLADETKNRPNPLPPAATCCAERYMVRRGSPVRVRKRALQSPRTPALFGRIDLQQRQRAEAMEPVMEPSGRQIFLRERRRGHRG